MSPKIHCLNVTNQKKSSFSPKGSCFVTEKKCNKRAPLLSSFSEEEHICSSWKESMDLGRRLGREAKEGSLFCLFGELGAGKTTVIKGIVEGALKLDSSFVSSPTFLYLNIYTHPESGKKLNHFDLYRLKGAHDFLEHGFDEFLCPPFITCIEWSERIESLLPPHTIALFLSHRSQESRHIRIKRWES